MKISKDPMSGYQIKIDGNRTIYKAANMQEVITALYHYEEALHKRYNARCPLCRAIKSEEQKKQHAFN